MRTVRNTLQICAPDETEEGTDMNTKCKETTKPSRAINFVRALRIRAVVNFADILFENGVATGETTI